MLTLSYRSPKTEVRASQIHGRGLFATMGIAKDEIVAVKGGHIVDRKTLRERITPRLGPVEIQIGQDLFTAPVTDEERELSMLYSNHSCNPNCYVDKWVVGSKFRMGIFAERTIAAGEELVFNYNVDRYGADPQPCYCGEPNCTGFIGGKTQTERATKLSHQTIQALGIDDGDGWDTTVAKKPRKKKRCDRRHGR